MQNQITIYKLFTIINQETADETQNKLYIHCPHI